MEIHGSYCVFQCAERGFNAPSEVVYFPDFFRTEFVFGKVCYDVLIYAVANGKTQDTKGYFVFCISFIPKIVESHPAEYIDRYREEVFSAVKIIMTVYENLDKAHVRYNRIDTVFNQMNCACIYAGFGEMERVAKLLERILSGFVPENEQERMVYGILENKLLEIRMCD